MSSNEVKIKELIKNEDFLITNHARQRMIEYDLSTDELILIVLNDDIIEEYLDDFPCPSALLISFHNSKPYHLVIGICLDHLRIITIYRPNKNKWKNFKIRKDEN